jgi:hypothetical protein
MNHKEIEETVEAMGYEFLGIKFFSQKSPLKLWFNVLDENGKHITTLNCSLSEIETISELMSSISVAVEKWQRERFQEHLQAVEWVINDIKRLKKIK